jgi:hypothetical protein
VAYKNGENEKLIGEFVKKHNVRDKVFGERDPISSIYSTVGSRLIALQLLQSVDLMSLAPSAR